MKSELTDFLLRITFQRQVRDIWKKPLEAIDDKTLIYNAQQLLQLIHDNLHSSQNHHNSIIHKSSLLSQDTDAQVSPKCKCKKSQCLKLYCECFAKGSYCKDCGCQCCKNTKQFGQIRAKTIDSIMQRAWLSLGRTKGQKISCNCKKSNCQKKYCECFGQGVGCGQNCGCQNCKNL